MKSGNIAETCRSHNIAATLYYRWKDEAEKAAVAALGGRNAGARPEEHRKRLRELERSLGKAHPRAVVAEGCGRLAREP